MKLTVRGAADQPVALLIHPALTGPSYFDDIVEALGGRYRVVLPTLDGHYDHGPDFTSVERSADELSHHLRSEGIEHIHALLGVGVGANVGLELLAGLPRGAVRLSVFEGAPLGSSRLGRASYLRRLRHIARAAREKKPGAARNLVDSRDEEYAALVVDQARAASDATLVALAQAANGAPDLPDLPEALQGFMTFVWGSYDQNARYARRVRETYPSARVVIKRGLPPHGYLLNNAECYVEEFLL